jgi:hypothetical protein
MTRASEDRGSRHFRMRGSTSVRDGERLDVAPFEVELAGRGGDFLVDERVSSDSGFGAVDSGVVAGRELPDYGQGCSWRGGRDDFGDGLALFGGDEDEFF